MKIALLGAESTGKTRLSHALAERLRERGLRVAVVAEVLREWCEREGRMPRPEEQLPIAQEQERRVDQAAAGAGIVIADTTALMVAIHGALLFPDHPLYRFAVERQRGYDLTLVMGLDLPWVADGLQRAGAHAREPVDALVRELLGREKIAYTVVYGQGAQRACAALAAIDATAPGRGAAAPEHRPWQWSCAHCGDASCEHRLFTRFRQG
ncbi:AAA family ATPase [Ramlibacter tataouinensis]|uniref:NadR/Ttd14 AAA domain-containing protein n=1 Tax=Ramlibacter tataouinensis (strain ATCC BAA-407 / DSM 14655 / LMG 21543 / TTB310) TaxID=365046 RepID=F5Y3M6_RAMTT|nr:AAA family ATPase [Ramlibacter tataouinensis]AEG93683.1 Conserved hypothetical protein [Ramlibacter tataouinensis TTB310]